ncbi:MAG TPA: S41 family peptidase [Gemmataceae bacterium]|nr:S41 family peptidase [Gemmataceae bacterium]
MNHRPLFLGRPVRLFLYLAAAFATGMFVEKAGYLLTPYAYTPPGLGKTFAPFWETWALVKQHYVDRKAINAHHMTQGAITGMLASLGDFGHTTYLTHEELEQMKGGLAGQFEGIGARLGIRKRQPIVVYTFPGSPARAAGLRRGDVLLEVNGRSVAGLPVERIAALVRGPAGGVVHLRIAREGTAGPLDLNITRGKVDVPDVSWHVLPAVPIAHVAIENFGEKAHAQLLAALEHSQAQGVRALIVDVRGNPGGLKDQAVAVTSEFLKGGNVFMEQDSEGARTEIPVEPGGHATDIPIVVLIDEGTASSAEIFAGAIQDHHRGKLVGARTFGTGTVLQPFGLSDGSAVLLAVTEWLTPNGRQIWHKGISPDVEVALPEGASILLPETEGDLDAASLAKSDDAQLLKALDLLKKQIQED